MADITDGDYTHPRRVWKDFKTKSLGESHDLNVLSDTLLLTNVFENFQNMSLEIYVLHPFRFLTLPGLAWKADLKKPQKIRFFKSIYY